MSFIPEIADECVVDLQNLQTSWATYEIATNTNAVKVSKDLLRMYLFM